MDPQHVDNCGPLLYFFVLFCFGFWVLFVLGQNFQTLICSQIAWGSLLHYGFCFHIPW